MEIAKLVGAPWRLTEVNWRAVLTPMIDLTSCASNMSPLRKHLHHLAVLVLLVWLFAAGAAIAKVCASHVHMDDSGNCCATMQATGVRSDSIAEAVTPAQSAQPWVGAVLPVQVVAPPALPDTQVPEIAYWNDSGQRIHLVLQRLAL